MGGMKNMKTLHLLLLLLAAAVANCFTPAGADLIITITLCALAVPVAMRMDREARKKE